MAADSASFGADNPQITITSPSRSGPERQAVVGQPGGHPARRFEEGALIYAGWSAGAVVAGPSLRGR